ncbi:hypothetical protein GJR96_09500 [Haloferax sp. MBLA0076]|uniref:Lipoprotein n=1 Tax=Haloferax litoreum TaxID=2666140 RepID=A0A6A8GH51_9EURY|nr:MULTISPECIES: hypothetical protein [Haloferax]KAB1193661.1 hypothetical protein Hfx1148_09480 [Haloferax sp. CBA1148]MRX22189.1 hypothetical protein [Haloferax litoreum]
MHSMWKALLVASLVLVAGCSGGTGGEDATTTATETGNLTATVTTTPTGGDDGSGGANNGDSNSMMFDFNQSWDQQFREGQYYRYEITSPNIDGTATYEWEVLDATEDEVTIRTKVVTEDSTSEQTVTAARDELYSELSGSPSGSIATVGFNSPYYSGVEGETLEVGDSWEASGTNGDVSFTVERTSSYAGLDCANFVVRTNGSVFWESCVSPESPLPGYMAFYEEEGDDEPVFEMTLVEYRPGN